MIKDINAYHVKWLCVFMGIGCITAFTLPYPLSILLGFGAVGIINVIKNRLKLSDNDQAKLMKRYDWINNEFINYKNKKTFL